MIGTPVGHGSSAHDVVVGDLSAALDRIVALADGQMLSLVTDDRVLALHGATLAPIALQPPILIAKGEAAKDWATLAAITNGLARPSVIATSVAQSLAASPSGTKIGGWSGIGASVAPWRAKTRSSVTSGSICPSASATIRSSAADRPPTTSL